MRTHVRVPIYVCLLECIQRDRERRAAILIVHGEWGTLSIGEDELSILSDRACATEKSKAVYC